MASIVLSKSGVVEYATETTFGTFPTNPAMNWIGLVQSFVANIETLHEEYRTLKASGATDKLQIEGAVKTGQAIEIDLEYILQNWNFFQYGMSSSGGGTLTDDLASLTLGLISPDSTAKYAKLSGVKIDSMSVEIPENDVAKCTMKLLGAHVDTTADNPWSTTDYIGTGSHATKSATAPIAWTDVTNITWGGSTISNAEIGGIKFEINNNLEAIKDVYGTTSTKVSAIEPAKREIKATLTLRKEAIDAIAADAIGFTSQDLVLTIGAKTLTFTGARIAKDSIDFAPEGMMSLDVDFVGITNFTIV